MTFSNGSDFKEFFCKGHESHEFKSVQEAIASIRKWVTSRFEEMALKRMLLTEMKGDPGSFHGFVEVTFLHL